ncbi:pirin [Microbacterium sp. Root61]|uniref:pirin family protein n=1 Tax=Microbacterium sp. Root61 TaxID=1736570 RepID=UPI0006F7D54F|nr:pirin family protein [Microbacterium sp. Root61]KRA25050.1 pirin [Microbacterium sp. Root61]
MSRFDVDAEAIAEATAPCDGPRALLLESRAVPLGGVRGMEVHRALPQRDLPMVGAWCFLDRFGPQVTRMRVEPHPHIGLQTVTWPFVGEVRHRDTVGSDVVVRRGALNLMTSGAGIAHSEYSVGEEAAALDALQLWVALPESRRHGAPAFERHESLPTLALDPVRGEPGTATVVMGELGDVHSPATAYTPIVGAEVHVPAGSRVRIPLRADWEYALAGVDGVVVIETVASVDAAHLLYLGTGRTTIELESSDGATVFLLGGEPFEDEIVMWWNFVARSHEEIVEARDAWEAGSARFGRVVGHGDERIPAPPLPHVRLTRRRRRV